MERKIPEQIIMRSFFFRKVAGYDGSVIINDFSTFINGRRIP